VPKTSLSWGSPARSRVHADALGGSRVAGGEAGLVEQELVGRLVPVALEAPAAPSEQRVDALGGALRDVQDFGVARRTELLEHERCTRRSQTLGP
jgi:hypothetical protein